MITRVRPMVKFKPLPINIGNMRKFLFKWEKLTIAHFYIVNVQACE